MLPSGRLSGWPPSLGAIISEVSHKKSAPAGALRFAYPSSFHHSSLVGSDVFPSRFETYTGPSASG